jgi:hypothetical protein
MTEAIFLSAGIPDPRRSPQYAKSVDTVAISAATTALVYVTLGRRTLVWGGQPSITPMIWTVAESLGVDYGAWVKLYQSRFFADEFPEDNERFKNKTFTESMGNREESLSVMRKRMFSDFNFTAAVFVGGAEGVVDEFVLLKRMQPKARMLPIASTGGGALEIANRIGDVPRDLFDDMDFVAMLHRHLDVSVRENRYPTPSDQPKSVPERYWNAASANQSPM